MNNSMIKQLLIFAAGAVVGSVATYVAMKDKCEKRIQDEVDSVKEALCRYEEDCTEPDEEESWPQDQEETDYNSIIQDRGYLRSEEPNKNESKPVKKYTECPPEVIPPEEYGEIEEYDQLEYRYYADCVVVDSDGEIVEGDEVEDTIGFESLNHFGDYESDSVYIRNDVRHAYYAVYKDLRKYSDVRTLSTKPRRMEV